MDSSSSSSSQKQVTNWLELPPEVMSLIFEKAGTLHILGSFQYVCSTWRKLCKEPHLFRSIDIYHDDGDDIPDEEYAMIVKLAKEAVSRSCGQLVKFCVQHFATDELLECIIHQNSPLKHLGLTSCIDISDSVVIEMAKKLPLLESLDIHYCDLEFPIEVLETFGRSCLRLDSLILNYWNYRDGTVIVRDDEAVVIAQTMPKLRYLDLAETYLTDNGLRAILDGCPHLNFLELSQCSNLTFGGDLVQICVDRNIKLRLLDEDSIYKLITRMQRQFLTLSEEHFKPIQAADLEAGLNSKFYTTSSSYKFLLSQLTQMQSILTVLEENIIEVMDEDRVVHMLLMVEVVRANLQEMISRTKRCDAKIMSYHSSRAAAARHEPTTS